MSYPVLLRLAGARVAVIGGGKVAVRKVAGLLAAGANVTVISPALSEPLALLAQQGRILWREQAYSGGALQSLVPLLVFAATDDPDVNAQVIAEAQSLGILADSASGEGHFSSMATLRRGRVTVAVGTDGSAPALAAYVRDQIDALLGEEYATLSDWLAELRPIVQETIASPDARRDLWRAVLDSDVVNLLRENDESAARSALRDVLAAFGVNPSRPAASGGQKCAAPLRPRKRGEGSQSADSIHLPEFSEDRQ